jgi:hypothetical protein
LGVPDKLFTKEQGVMCADFGAIVWRIYGKGFLCVIVVSGSVGIVST